MRKILIDAGVINRGGAVQVALSAISFAAKYKKYEWHLLASGQILNQLDETILRGFKSIKRVSMITGTDRLRMAFIAYRYSEKIKPDLVYTLMGPTYWSPKSIHLQGFALPLLLHDKKYYENPMAKIIFNPRRMLLDRLKIFLIKKSDYVVVETDRIKELFSDRLSFPKDKVFVVENSYSPIFNRLIKSEKWKRKDEKVPVVFVPSAYYEHKNLEFVPRVAASLKTKNFIVRFRFLLDPSSVPWRKIIKIGKKYDVENHLQTIGVLKHREMPFQYIASKLVFLPTLVEASTAVYPESFMAGVPLVTSDRYFAKELCGDAATYCDPFDPENAAAKIIELLSNRRERELKIKKGRSVLSKSYHSPNKKWINTIRIIDSILKKETLN